ncbi:hypothetical protein CYY_009148 [Polysphondylium violaceum]|uniref:Glycosyltransferase n=1 Tax=Polysphondylium violaceum TaxID=133409 RepID=A0A8J4UWC5_9MYCE|nr:hypothetical protein CYY_009148 [Polysphondylium violaceum]
MKDVLYSILIILHLIFIFNLLFIIPSLSNSTSYDIKNNNNNNNNNNNQQIPNNHQHYQQQQQQRKSNHTIIHNGNSVTKEPTVKPSSWLLNNSKNIYVTFSNNDQYTMGIIALKMSMIDVGCKYDLLVYVTSDVSQEMRTQMEAIKCIVVETEMVEIPKEITVQIERWRPAFTKFRAWQMTDYDRIIWLDSDMLLLKSLDPLFELVDPLHPTKMYAAIDADANSCNYKPERLRLINSGIMVLTPSLDIYTQLIDGMVLASKILPTVNDQDVINITIPDWKALSYPEHGVQITHCECSDKRLWNFEPTYFIHFTAGLKELPKPWKLLHKDKKYLDSIMSSCISQLYSIWIDTYNRALDLVHEKKLHQNNKPDL